MFWGMTDSEKVANATGCVSESWFAWRPVRLSDGRWCWLEYVWRKWECDSLAPNTCGWTYSQNHF